MLTITSYFIAKELQKRGYVISETENESLVLFEKNKQVHFYHDSLTPNQSGASVRVCSNKYLTKLILDKNNYPTAKWVKISKNTTDAASGLRFPVVIKPLREYGGKGVSVGIASVLEIDKYFDMHPEYTDVVAEEMLAGDDIRVLLVQGKFFAAVRREPASVNGDGSLTIDELILIENKRRKKIIELQNETREYTYDFELIRNDSGVDETLHMQKLKRTTIPAAGQKVFVRRNANVSSGGMAVDVTETVCEEIQSLCEQIGKSLSMTTLGIDIMTEDVTKPIDIGKNWGIIEVNVSPGLGLHMFPGVGTARNPIPLIVDEMEEYLQNTR